MSKKKYRLDNWKKYNKSLEERGSIEIWFDKRISKGWYCQDKNSERERGRPLKYSKEAIKVALVLKYLHCLAFRQLEGFIKSLVHLMNLQLEIPDYSTICKRQKDVNTKILSKHRKSRKLYLIFDSSGLKVYGEGEWKVRQYGYEKRRTWRKIHVGLGVTAGKRRRIEVISLTDKNQADVKEMPRLLDKVEGRIDNILGDGAYDVRRCYRAALARGCKMIAPPRKGAAIQHINGRRAPPTDERNRHVRFIRKFGLECWKQRTHYHQRSLVENVFFRFKTIFGDKLATRKFENQEIETLIKCQILNRMSELGMPHSYVVT